MPTNSNSAHLKLNLFGAVLMFFGAVASQPARAATEIARTPYQINGTVECEAQLCRVFFPLVATKRRLDIRHVACTYVGIGLDSAPGSTLISNNALSASLSLAWTSPRTVSGNVWYDVSQPIYFSIFAGQRPFILVYRTGTSASISCSIAGDLIFLQ
jgi:hypothetical protein